MSYTGIDVNSFDHVLERARRGDEDACGCLLVQHRGAIRRAAFAILKNHDDVDDVVQEVSLRVFLKIHTFQGDSRFTTWLTAITINTSLMRLRQLRTRPTSFLEDVAFGSEASFLPLADWRRNPEQQYMLRDTGEKMVKAINRLPVALRVVALEHLCSDLPLQDIARKHNLSLAAVKSRASRARIKLREFLNRDELAIQPAQPQYAHSLQRNPLSAPRHCEL